MARLSDAMLEALITAHLHGLERGPSGRFRRAGAATGKLDE